MTFIGRLKQNSTIWHRWRGEARTGGAILGVQFSWEPGNIYRTLPLTSDQILLLQGHDNIILEAVSVDLPDTIGTPVARPEKPVVSAASSRVNSTPAGRR